MTNSLYTPLVSDANPNYTAGMYPGQITEQPASNLNQQARQNSIEPDFDPQYTQARIDQWNQIPNDESDFSSLWSESDCFEASVFSENIKKIKQWNDLGWTIAFWLNFLITLIITIVLAAKYRHLDYTEYEKYSSSLAIKSLGIAFGVSLAVNVLHIVYILFFPLFYIRFGLIIGVIYTIFFVAIPSLVHGNYVCLLFPLLMIVGAIFFFILGNRNAVFTSAILEQATRLILRYFTIIIFFVFAVLVDSIINAAFSYITFLVQANRWSNWFYIYVFLSYTWISLTFSYVAFMVASGLAASWYFLERSSYFPKNPVLSSFKRSATTSFGSASLAGFIMAVINTLQFLVNTPPNTGNQVANAIIQVLKCIASCILGILQGCFKMINQYALCYVSIYGVPFAEGARRWFEIRTKRLINVTISGMTIERCLQFNMMVFVVGGSLLALGFGYWAFPDKNSEGRILVPAFTAMMSFGIFKLLEQPIIGIADTLIICFAEAPKLLQTSAYELYEILLKRYGQDLLNQKLDNGHI